MDAAPKENPHQETQSKEAPSSATRTAEERRSRQMRLGALALLVVMLLVASGIGGLAIGAGGAALTGKHPTPTTRPGDRQPGVSLPQPNTVQQENLLPGTTDWIVPPGKRSSTQIQAYLSATSVRPGRILTFFVSVQNEGASYSIDVYRLGWYGGKGGRLLHSAQQTGHAQGYYDQARGRLVNCGSCRTDPSLGLVEANWRASYRLTIPDTWVTGVYLAKFTDAGGMQTYTTFDVVANDHATYVIVTADTTVQAYNEWGGYSLYIWRMPGGPGGHARKVSFDRPVAGWGDEQGLLYEIDGIRWLERNGYDVSYISSVDLHEDPGQLLNHKAYLTLGHDEYWSAQMRDGVERARDAGVGLGFFGANISYWQIRFEPDSRGASDRTIVCYKESQADPLIATDRAHVTTQWRNAPVNRPENDLIGIMYTSWATQPTGFPWQMGTDMRSPLLQGTGLQPNQRYGCDLVGYEWDRVFPNGRTPAGLRILSTSYTVDHTGLPSYSNTAYYVAKSGALVFAAGTIDWTFALDDFRLFSDVKCAGQSQVMPELQRLTTNVMAALATHQDSAL